MDDMRAWVLVVGGISASSDAVYGDQNPIVPHHRTVEVNARQELGKVVEVGSPVPNAAYNVNPRFEAVSEEDENFAVPRAYAVRADPSIGGPELCSALARAVGQIPFAGAPGPYSLVVALFDDAGTEVGRETVEQR
jgi:hypothetical protein